MKIFLKRVMMMLLIATITIQFPQSTKVSKASESGINVNEFVSSIEKAMDITGVLDAISSEEELTRCNAAVLVESADEIKNGTDYNENLYNQVKSKNRISDISEIDDSKQETVIKVFIKGIMIGDSNGKYTHTRKFLGNSLLTKKEAKGIISKLVKNSVRSKLSPDGQLIRTTKLPKNYKKYSYILGAFPNAFYEKKFKYEKAKFHYKPKEFEDYASPVRLLMSTYNEKPMQEIMDANLDMWAEKIKTNLETRLNADYRTIDKEWINRLRKTYYIYNDATQDKKDTNCIKDYVKQMKKNKTIVIGSVSVEPSTLYLYHTFYIRTYIKFKVVSAKSMKDLDENVIYGREVNVPHIKKGKWNEMYVDIDVSTATWGGYGEDFAVTIDNID